MNRLAQLGLLSLAVACSAPRASAPPASAPRASAPPASAPAPATDLDAWRTHRPPPGPPPALTLPHFQRAMLSNGVTVLVEERRDLPLVSLGVAFAAGGAADPPDRPGVADLTYRVMLEGAGAHSALGLAEAFADFGTTPAVVVQPDGALIALQVLARNAEPALALIAEIVQRPRFNVADVDRRREERRADLYAREQDPRAAGQNAMTAAVYGAKHPYGHPTAGTSATISSVRHSDIRAFYQRWVGPKAAAVVVTGDVTLAEATAWAENYFGNWRGRATRPPRPPPLTAPIRHHVFFLSRPGLDQTFVFAGRTAIAAGDVREAPMDLLLTAFGGNFGSRLNLQLREAKGISYGASAYLDTRRGGGAWVAASAIQANATGAGVSEVMSEMQRLKTHPVSETELDTARGALVRALPSSFETTDSTALALTSLFFHERPLNEYAREVAQLESTRAEALVPLVDQFFSPATVQLVLVGDPEVIRTAIVPLGLGPLEPAPEPASANAPGRAP